LLIFAGKHFNFLVTNKWRNLEVIGQLKDMPLLMLVSGQVRKGFVVSAIDVLTAARKG
jgi:hypothetical protein